jgi:2OG-Fe(II) oxygenase superfamily
MEASFPVAATSEIGDRLKRAFRLPDKVENLHAQYLAPRPFAHLVLDGLFSEEAMEDLLREIPSLRDDRWVQHEEKRLTNLNLRSAADLGEIGYQRLSFLHSSALLYLLTELTGVWHMVPDSYVSGGATRYLPADGSTCTPIGTWTTIPPDAKADDDYLSEPRLEAEYGEQLEPWSKGASRCEVVVGPLFNRTLLFEVADRNFHGVRPVEREGMERRSLALYFHTVGLPDGKTASPHNSIYAPTFYRKRPEIKHILRDCIALIAARGSKISRQVGNQRQAKYHQYSQIPAKCIASSKRVADRTRSNCSL